MPQTATLAAPVFVHRQHCVGTILQLCSGLVLFHLPCLTLLSTVSCVLVNRYRLCPDRCSVVYSKAGEVAI